MPTNRDENLRHWKDLFPTDPKYTKPFQRPGGFRGTDVDRVWRVQRLTEHFGPYGSGWGTREPKYTTHEIAGEIVVYCVLECWYTEHDEKTGEQIRTIYGIGGDRVVQRRSDQTLVNDEAFKAAFTDALMNAFMRVGLSADIWLNLHADSKYLANVREHYENTRAIQQQLEEKQNNPKDNPNEEPKTGKPTDKGFK